MPKTPHRPPDPHPTPVPATPAVTPARQHGQPRELTEFLESQYDRIAKALPRHLTPERLIQVVSMINFRTPKLQQCAPSSIFAAVIQASTLGLDLAPSLGEAYLIPRKNRDKDVMECHFQPGYRGLAKLARQSGGCTYIKAMLVHERDVFAYRYTPDLVFEHAPHLGMGRGAVTHCYAVAKLATGEHLIEVMTTEEIGAIHHRSESFLTAQRYNKQESGPWVSDWGEMAKKTVTKRLCKSLSMSPELADAIEADNAEYQSDEPGRPRARVAPRRGVAGLAEQLGLEEKPLPPQPTRTYTEADDPMPDEAQTAKGTDEPEGVPPDEPGWEPGRE